MSTPLQTRSSHELAAIVRTTASARELFAAVRALVLRHRCGHNDEFINSDGAIECADCGRVAA